MCAAFASRPSLILSSPREWGRVSLAALTLALSALIPWPVNASAFLPETGSGPSLALRKLVRDQADAEGMIRIDDMVFRSRDVLESGFTGPKWTGGIVYYDFHPNVTASQRSLWIQAARHWANSANIRFQQRPMGQQNYILIRDDDSNYSNVGMVGGSQLMGIVNWDYLFVIAHEIGHALGLDHEHVRSDRAPYVTINEINIIYEHLNDFELQATTNFGSYDFDSVMHYDQCAYAINCAAGKSITANPPYQGFQNTMGQLDHLSAADRAGMAMRYGAPIPGSSPQTIGGLAALLLTGSAIILARRRREETLERRPTSLR